MYTLQDITAAAEKMCFSKSMLQKFIECLPVKRSGQQNKALHVLFSEIAYELNQKGFTFQYKGLKGKKIECTYTAELIKYMIWKPLQQALTGKESTRDLTTSEINAVFDILSKWCVENEIIIDFPSVESISKKK